MINRSDAPVAALAIIGLLLSVMTITMFTTVSWALTIAGFSIAGAASYCLAVSSKSRSRFVLYTVLACCCVLALSFAIHMGNKMPNMQTQEKSNNKVAATAHQVISDKPLHANFIGTTPVLVAKVTNKTSAMFDVLGIHGTLIDGVGATSFVYIRNSGNEPIKPNTYGIQSYLAKDGSSLLPLGGTLMTKLLNPGEMQCIMVNGTLAEPHPNATMYEVEIKQL